MTTTELHDLEALLERALPDPMGFVDRVLGQLLDRLAETPAGPAPAVVAGYEAELHQRLEDRNVVLAAALGACECWGEQPDCPECHGAGSSGWQQPDPALYDELVRPAAGRTVDHADEMKENADDEHVAG
jgi:hypothetical protein